MNFPEFPQYLFCNNSHTYVFTNIKHKIPNMGIFLSQYFN
jgi:hypothetical protein